MKMRTMFARYSGYCHGCDGVIEKGLQIFYDSDARKVYHVKCDPRGPKTAEPVKPEPAPAPAGRYIMQSPRLPCVTTLSGRVCVTVCADPVTRKTHPELFGKQFEPIFVVSSTNPVQHGKAGRAYEIIDGAAFDLAFLSLARAEWPGIGWVVHSPKAKLGLQNSPMPMGTRGAYGMVGGLVRAYALEVSL